MSLFKDVYICITLQQSISRRKLTPCFIEQTIQTYILLDHHSLDTIFRIVKQPSFLFQSWTNKTIPDGIGIRELNSQIRSFLLSKVPNCEGVFSSFTGFLRRRFARVQTFEGRASKFGEAVTLHGGRSHAGGGGEVVGGREGEEGVGRGHDETASVFAMSHRLKAMLLKSLVSGQGSFLGKVGYMHLNESRP